MHEVLPGVYGMDYRLYMDNHGMGSVPISYMIEIISFTIPQVRANPT